MCTSNTTEMNEFIPTYGLELVIEHSTNHYTFKINMTKFLEINMKIWKYNRPANSERIDELVKSLEIKKYPLSFNFQCIYNKTKNRLELIDGQHRYNSVKQLQTKIKDDGTNKWFYSSILLIEIKINDTEDKEVKEWFQIINNSIPTPDLYINPEDIKKEIIEEVVNKYHSLYKIHFTGAINPNICNTNIEKFTDLICYIYETHEISLENKKNIYKLLEDINILIEEKVKNDDPKKFNKKITQKSMEKCYKTGLFLFLSNEAELKYLIRNYQII